MSGLSQHQSPPSRGGHRSTQSQSQGQAMPRNTQSSDGVNQGVMNSEVMKDYFLNLTRCNTIGDLVRLIPVPVQPASKDILDSVYIASMKLGGAEALQKLWKDKLRSNDLQGVAQLNSMKAPTVQVAKEAIGTDDGGLSSMNLDTVLHEAKKNALTQMILIKDQEVTNLRNFVHVLHIGRRLRSAWDHVLALQASAITDEHSALLREDEFTGRVAQVAASIGESSYQRSHLSRQKRLMAKQEADISMTDASEGQSQKQLMTLVEEALKRKEQSRRDRTRSGKGKGSSAPPKKAQKPKQKKQQRQGGSKPRGAKRQPFGKRQERR